MQDPVFGGYHFDSRPSSIHSMPPLYPGSPLEAESRQISWDDVTLPPGFVPDSLVSPRRAQAKQTPHTTPSIHVLEIRYRIEESPLACEPNNFGTNYTDAIYQKPISLTRHSVRFAEKAGASQHETPPSLLSEFSEHQLRVEREHVPCKPPTNSPLVYRTPSPIKAQDTWDFLDNSFSTRFPDHTPMPSMGSVLPSHSDEGDVTECKMNSPLLGRPKNPLSADILFKHVHEVCPSSPHPTPIPLPEGVEALGAGAEDDNRFMTSGLSPSNYFPHQVIGGFEDSRDTDDEDDASLETLPQAQTPLAAGPITLVQATSYGPSPSEPSEISLEEETKEDRTTPMTSPEEPSEPPSAPSTPSAYSPSFSSVPLRRPLRKPAATLQSRPISCPVLDMERYEDEDSRIAELANGCNSLQESAEEALDRILAALLKFAHELDMIRHVHAFNRVRNALGSVKVSRQDLESNLHAKLREVIDDAWEEKYFRYLCSLQRTLERLHTHASNVVNKPLDVVSLNKSYDRLHQYEDKFINLAGKFTWLLGRLEARELHERLTRTSDEARLNHRALMEDVNRMAEVKARQLFLKSEAEKVSGNAIF